VIHVIRIELMIDQELVRGLVASVACSLVQLGALLSPALVDRPASRGGLEMHATNLRSGLNGCFRLRRARAWPRCRRSSGVRNLRVGPPRSPTEDADATSTTSVSADNGLGSEGRLVVHV
jgi:hypothetical protein